jgi:hypothetical protein
MLDYTSVLYVLRSIDSPPSAVGLLSESNAIRYDKGRNVRVYTFADITLQHYGFVPLLFQFIIHYVILLFDVI